MESFSADWLALREPADTAARSESLTRLAGARLSLRGRVRAIDLACGTGANVRYLAGRLPMSAAWTLVDHDRALLDEARRRLRHGPLGDDYTLTTRCLDLAQLDATHSSATTWSRHRRCSTWYRRHGSRPWRRPAAPPMQSSCWRSPSTGAPSARPRIPMTSWCAAWSYVISVTTRASGPRSGPTRRRSPRRASPPRGSPCARRTATGRSSHRVSSASWSPAGRVPPRRSTRTRTAARHLGAAAAGARARGPIAHPRRPSRSGGVDSLARGYCGRRAAGRSSGIRFGIWNTDSTLA